ncbi:MAG: cysteine hydrolase [Polaromonas sp.]|nr:cysteine hydrolase [Polaromonas sp.]
MEFPQWVVDRVVARQGRLHPFDRLDAGKLAFVVIDMQNYFLLPEFPAAVPAAPGTIAGINRLCQAVRSAGGLVVWIQTTSVNADVHLALHHDETLTPERKRRRLENLAPGSRGHALHAALDVQPQDPCVEKICFSAMVQGSSSLKALLDRHGIETLLIGGTATNVCCDSTGRDAMMQNYRAIMVDDALSAFTDVEHAWALQNWMLFFGDVLSIDEVTARLHAGSGQRQAA